MNLHSPIVDAIREAEHGTTGEIRVHLSRAWVERDAFARAQRLFALFGMGRTTQRNAVLLYVNTRRRKFAVVADEGLLRKTGQRYWEQLARELHFDLHSTHLENAIALAVTRIGAQLRKHFPAEISGP